MQIIKSKDIGFCFGVKRAIKKAEQALTNFPSRDIYMLGEIIHNPQVIKDFISKGINIIKEIEQVPSDKYLVTRTHGISKKEEEYAKNNNIKLIETTCPYVKQLQQIAKTLQRDRYQIVVLGDIDHPEITSLLSYIDNQAYVIQSVEEMKHKYYQFSKKIGLLSQTTKDIEQFQQLIKEIFNYAEELRVFNTICKATRLRQQSIQELAKTVDLMIVIGGLNSANTKRLAYLSKKEGIETYHIENEQQLNKEWFKGKEKIGIASGTSTPSYITDEIILKIKQINIKR